MPLTEQEREVMSESEIAKFEEAEAEVTAAKEREEAEAQRKEEIEATVASELARIQAERDEEARLEAERQAEIDRQEPPADEYERLAKLSYDDPVAYQKEILRMATERATVKVMAEADAKYGGVAQRVRAAEVEDTLSEGLGAKGREYIKGYAHMISPDNAKDPKVQDLIRRAAKQYEAEQTTKREAIERTHEETPTVSAEDRKAADMFAEIAARASGVPLEKLRLNNAQLAAAKEDY